MLSHSHSKILGFQINYLSHISLSNNSHLHLFLFQRWLLLQTIASNLHLHLHFSCYSINLVSLVLDIRLNTFTFKFFYNIRNTNFWIRIINIITTAATFAYFNTKRIKCRIITININNLVSHSWYFIEIQFKEFAFIKLFILRKTLF